MSDATYHPEQPNPWPRGSASTAPPVKEPTINERASGLLTAMTDAQRHNAPITPWMLSELGAVVAQVTGNKVAAPRHLITDARGLPSDLMWMKADGTFGAIYSAEEALAYVRSLPKDVQARPHWVAADKALTEAVASVLGSDVSPAIRLFEAALAEDRRLDSKPVTIAAKPGAVPVA